LFVVASAVELPADEWVQDVFAADEPAVAAVVFRVHFLQKRVSAHRQVFCTPGLNVVAAGWAKYKSLAWFVPV
jgi:hypothetical protein